jgi:hypothetical protein
VIVCFTYKCPHKDLICNNFRIYSFPYILSLKIV